MSAKKVRVPVTFSVRVYEPHSELLPDGRVFESPRHWRLHDVATDEVLASGPAKSEHVILSLVQMAAGFMRQNPRLARKIVADNLPAQAPELRLLQTPGADIYIPTSAVQPDARPAGSELFRQLEEHIKQDDVDTNQLEDE